ncbi:MAG: hypothetical protein ACKV2V_29020 [Blastocatellia bacterium]
MPNQIIEAIRNQAIPTPAKIAAARAMLPMTQEESLEAIVLLCQDADTEVSKTAQKTLADFDKARLKNIVTSKDTAADVLGWLCTWRGGTREIYEGLVINRQTSGQGIAELAKWQRDGSLLELITVNQQRLIDTPDIIEAIIANNARTPEAERRAREIKTEFFEKELGAKRISDERRARAAAISNALGFDKVQEDIVMLFSDDMPVEELMIDDAALHAQFHIEMPPEMLAALLLDPNAPMLMEDLALPDEEAIAAEAARIAMEAQAEGQALNEEQSTWMQRILRMNTKQRVKIAIKGDREARGILMRDPNKIVLVAVLNNPRITEAEVEAMTKMKTVPEDALRIVGLNRAWMRNYLIINNLVRNPRTPVATSMPLLNRLFPKDLKDLVGNRNVPEAIRKTAQRLIQARNAAH